MNAKKELQTTPEKSVNTLQMISDAISNGMTMEHIEKFMELHERNEANEAKKAYHKAFAAFKANPPTIIKDMKVSHAAKGGQKKYNHASIGNVVSSIIEGLGEHGLSHHWPLTQSKDEITVECILTHELGYSEKTSLTAPPDPSGGKNTIQSIASTVTYLQRYTLLSITGMATSEMDDDAKGNDPKRISSDEIIKNIKWGLENGKTSAEITSYMNGISDSIDLLSLDDVKKVRSEEIKAVDELILKEDKLNEPTTTTCPEGGIQVAKADCDECNITCDIRLK